MSEQHTSHRAAQIARYPFSHGDLPVGARGPLKADPFTTGAAMVALFAVLAGLLDELAAIGGGRGSVLSAARNILDEMGVDPASPGASHVLGELSK